MSELRIDKEKCKACGLCILYCPQKCLKLSASLNNKGYHYVEPAPGTSCGGCAICHVVCPDVCIRVTGNKWQVTG